MQILHRKDEGLRLRRSHQELDDRGERQLFLALGRETARLESRRQRQGEQVGEQRQLLAVQVIARQHVLDGVTELRQQGDDRLEGARLRLGIALAFQPRLSRQPFSEVAYQSRLADAGLAGEEHRRRAATRHALPHGEEVRALDAAVDQHGARRRRTERRRASRGLLGDAIERERAAAVRRLYRAKGLGGELVAQQPPRVGAHQDLAAAGALIEGGGYPRRVTHDLERGIEGRFGRLPNDDERGVDADVHVDVKIGLRLETGRGGARLSDDPDRRSQGVPGVVLVRPWISEYEQQPIRHRGRDDAPALRGYACIQRILRVQNVIEILEIDQRPVGVSCHGTARDERELPSLAFTLADARIRDGRCARKVVLDRNQRLAQPCDGNGSPADVFRGHSLQQSPQAPLRKPCRDRHGLRAQLLHDDVTQRCTLHGRMTGEALGTTGEAVSTTGEAIETNGEAVGMTGEAHRDDRRSSRDDRRSSGNAGEARRTGV